MGKAELEFSDTVIMGTWKENERFKGVFEKALTRDPCTGNVTKLVRYAAGTVIPVQKVHDYCEEVYVLDGYMIDTAKQVIASKGYYACRPVGMKHGPYEIPIHCTLLEMCYQDPCKETDPHCSLVKEKSGEPH